MISNNIQRRVYDALNVFSAINIVKKHKNKIVYTNHNYIGVDKEDQDQSSLFQPEKPDSRESEIKDISISQISEDNKSELESLRVSIR